MTRTKKKGRQSTKVPQSLPGYRGELLSRPRFFRIEEDGSENEVRLQSRQGLALLAYLHVRGEGISRERILDLLWHENDSETARASLRVLLARLRNLLPGLLVTDTRTVALASRQISWDTVRFDELMRRGTASALTEAARLFKGNFMQDFDLGVSSDFERWLEAEREHWNQRYNALMRKLVDLFLSQGRGAKALPWIERWRKLAPESEAAHRQHMYLRWKEGEAEPALAHYRKLVQTLEHELGIGPEESTQELYETILGSLEQEAASDGATTLSEATQDLGENDGEALDPYTLYHSSADLTSFVGRERELEELVAVLKRQRLVTVHGPGGVGKTRLALEASRALQDHFLGGSFFVTCETIGALELSARLTTLTASLQTTHEPALVVLDSLEFVQTEHTPILRLIREVPHVTVLISGRSVLRLLGERRLELSPLPYPGSDALKNADELAQNPSVQLFWERAFFEEAASALARGEARLLAYAGRVARAMSGLPLGLEIAASRIGVHSLSELARFSERSPHRLHAEHAVVSRHESLAHAAATSWVRLEPEQQQLLTRLAQCPEPFSLEDVLGKARPQDLGPLLHESWLLNPNPCFSFPKPFRHFVLEQLETVQAAK